MEPTTREERISRMNLSIMFVADAAISPNMRRALSFWAVSSLVRQ